MERRKIAIACQGGGSQTAFTAGVLSEFFDRGLHLQRHIVSLSGTSGGAVCAALAWFGLLKQASGDRASPSKRILAFWEEIIPQLPPERAVDQGAADLLRLVEEGAIPHLTLSPASALSQMMMATLMAFLPRKFFTDLRAVLEAHINFADIPRLVKPDSPVLILGAADVLTGELKKFSSRDGEICAEAILASAAIPSLFPAVELNGHYYWDGLFSDNPPIKELIRGVYVGFDNIPDEVWVIQINPIAIDAVPKTSAQIADRRNELEGNVSMMQSLEFVDFYNMLLREKLVDCEALARHGFRRTEPITVRFVRMSDQLQSELDYVSKLSRAPAHIHKLIADGRQQGAAFLESLHAAVGAA